MGTDPFTAKILEVLFLKKGLSVSNAEAEKRLYIETMPGDLVLLDSPDQVYEREDIMQVLLSNFPAQSPFLKYWIKTPVNEESIDNLLFYMGKKEFLIEPSAGRLSFSTVKLSDFLGDDEVSKKEVVAEFIATMHTNYRTLETCVQTADIAGVQDTSHKMLSGSEYYEVEVLNRLLKTMEREDSYPPGQLDALLRQVYGQVIALRSGLILKFF